MEVDDLGEFVAHFAKVHSIDNLTGNVVTLGAIDDLLKRCRSFHGRAHGKEIVFANEDDRQLVKRGEIERFMKGALIDRAVAEKTKRDAIFVSIFAGEGQSGRERHVRADNGVPAVHVILAIEEMHRAAEPARAAGFFAEELGHAGVGAGSARERVGVIAIRGDDVIVLSRRRDRADRRPLPGRCKDGRSRRFSAPDIVDWRVLQNAGSTTSARASRLRRAARAALRSRSARQRFRARTFGAPIKAQAKDEEQGEKEIAQKRIAKKHPAGRGAVLRKTNGERLNQTGEILHVTGIAQPGECVGDDIKNCRPNNRRRQQRFERSAILERQAYAPNNREREVPA